MNYEDIEHEIVDAECEDENFTITEATLNLVFPVNESEPDSEYLEGVNARDIGLDKWSNPYTYGTRQYNRWVRGWKDGGFTNVDYDGYDDEDAFDDEFDYDAD